MSLTAAERETVITCDDELKMWNVLTYQSKIITKLKKLNIEPERIDVDGGHYYKNLKFNQISFRSGKKREMTDEQRLKVAERLRKAREKK